MRRETRNVNSIDVPQAMDVGEAHPRLIKVVETMIQKGKWTVPGTFSLGHFGIKTLILFQGYKEKFGDLNVM